MESAGGQFLSAPRTEHYGHVAVFLGTCGPWSPGADVAVIPGQACRPAVLVRSGRVKLAPRPLRWGTLGLDTGAGTGRKRSVRHTAAPSMRRAGR